MNTDTTIRDHSTFRIILQGMSHPGKVYALPDLSGKESSAVELLGCLMDNEVKFAVLGDTDLEAVLVRHTDSRPTSVEDADFVIACNGTTNGRLVSFNRGSLEYPDKGATILYLVEELSENEGEITLSGPGINGKAVLRISGLPLSELHLLGQVNREFPLGIDAIFLDRSGSIVCIPRSSHIGVN